jgi:UDP-hydrolysing UDP-N-acetyl-D-glucosamine 2-epimerase
MRKRRICVVLVDRANYGRMKPVMTAIKEHPDLEMLLVCSGSMLLERFGSPVQTVQEDGFRVDGRVYVELEGSTPTTMAKSVGFATIEFASEFHRLQPDIVLLIGDRYEALAAAIAAAYQNLCISHIQGGEVSGSIDESARHAITKFAHYHFPATQRSGQYLIHMGEDPATVFHVGCPSGDIILNMNGSLPPDTFQAGIGAPLHPDESYLLVIYHPVTTAYGTEEGQVQEVLAALTSLEYPAIWLWPNIDAGADHISRCLRRYREMHGDRYLRLIKGFPPDVYQQILKRAACAVGNSSSFVRDASFTGTPVVLVGDRQFGREVAENVMQVPPRASEVLDAIQRQICHGSYPPSLLYGDGNASSRIASILSQVPIYRQKHLFYACSGAAAVEQLEALQTPVSSLALIT